MPETVELLICVKCRRGEEIAEDGERPGAALHRALAEVGVEGVRITPVECLSNCSQGCTVALRGGERWSYVYGGFDPETDAPIVAEGAAKYAAAEDGLVPWRERPEHFRKNCIARIPPLTLPS
ncbi:MAG: DUF1636 domain-containing protein [Pseudomonadota bacterium]